jgi:dolichyl-phosphate beta-glucosyltransferase
MDLSVIVPTYNESKNIENTLVKIEEYFKKEKINGEIIVVDDASCDDTAEKVRKLTRREKNIFLTEMEKNYYKGWPVKIGMLKAVGNYIMYTDADLSTPIEEAKKLKKAIDSGADIAIGSRVHEGGIDLRKSQPLYRQVLGKIFSNLKNFLISDIADSQCGFKMYKKDAAKKLFEKQRIKNIIFEVEILYLAKKLNYKVVQVPVEWKHSKETRMRVSVGNAVNTLSSLIKIWFWHH